MYDNAQANAVMQKAITILNIEESLSHKRREKFRTFIHEDCSPKVDFYDDDAADADDQDLKKVTIQIKVQMVMVIPWHIVNLSRLTISGHFFCQKIN